MAVDAAGRAGFWTRSAVLPHRERGAGRAVSHFSRGRKHSRLLGRRLNGMDVHLAAAAGVSDRAVARASAAAGHVIRRCISGEPNRALYATRVGGAVWILRQY